MTSFRNQNKTLSLVPIIVSVSKFRWCMRNQKQSPSRFSLCSILEPSRFMICHFLNNFLPNFLATQSKTWLLFVFFFPLSFFPHAMKLAFLRSFIFLELIIWEIEVEHLKGFIGWRRPRIINQPGNRGVEIESPSVFTFRSQTIFLAFKATLGRAPKTLLRTFGVERGT